MTGHQPKSSTHHEETSASNRELALWALIASFVALAVFLPSLSTGFVIWDDDHNFLDNREYRGLGWSNLRWMFTTFHMGHYQPLSWLSLGVNFALGGMRPFGYHLTNILLHAANTFILTFVIARLLAIPAASFSGALSALRPNRSHVRFAFAIALVWAVHPLRVEAVTWITQRREVLCAFFTLLTLWSHLRARPRWITVVLAALAMLSKATPVTLPVLLVLIDLFTAGYPARPIDAAFWKKASRLIVRHAPIIALAAACSITAVFAQRHTSAMLTAEQLSGTDRLIQFGYNLGFYFQKSLWPTGLAALYESAIVEAAGRCRIDTAWLRPLAVAAAVGILLIGLAGWIFRRRAPWMLPLLIAYIAMIAPVGGLGQSGPQVAADRYTYQPGIVVTLGAALAFIAIYHAIRGTHPPKSLVIASAISVAAPLSWLTVRQQGYWQTTEDLWKRVIDHHPQSGYAQLNFGLLYAAKSPPDDANAEPHLREAHRLRPWDPDAASVLADLCARTGRIGEARLLYESALQRSPSHKPSLFPMACILFSPTAPEQSLELLHRLLATDPMNPASHQALARALAASGRTAEAANTLEAAVQQLPQATELWRDLVWIRSTSPDDSARSGKRAVEAAGRLQALAPPASATLATILALAAAHAEAGDFDQAIAIVTQAQSHADAGTSQTLALLFEQLKQRQPVRAAARFP